MGDVFYTMDNSCWRFIIKKITHMYVWTGMGEEKEDLIVLKTHIVDLGSYLQFDLHSINGHNFILKDKREK